MRSKAEPRVAPTLARAAWALLAFGVGSAVVLSVGWSDGHDRAALDALALQTTRSPSPMPDAHGSLGATPADSVATPGLHDPQGLAGSGSLEDGSETHAGATAVSTAVPVSTAKADAYLAQAAPNEAATRLVSDWYAEQVHKHDIQGVHWVDCRGWLCKATFQLASFDEALQMRRMDVSRDGGEHGFVTFAHATQDGTEVTVVVYNALPGSRFATLFAGGGPDERLAPQVATALAARRAAN